MSSPDKELHRLISRELVAFVKSDLEYVQHVHSKVIKADSSGEISSINRSFYISLRKKFTSKQTFELNQIKLLDKANVYTWLAYSIYDDVIDEDKVEHLSSANILIRASIETYLSAGVDYATINHYINEVDEANMLECKNRTSDSASLALLDFIMPRKSIAHCLGQIWIVGKVAPSELSRLLPSFYSYCSARQLNDDIYDWRDDISNGHHTYATRFIEEQLTKLNMGAYELTKTQLLNISFWEYGLEKLCADVENHINKSIKSFKTVLLANSTYEMCYLRPISHSATQSVKSHQAAKKSLLSKT